MSKSMNQHSLDILIKYIYKYTHGLTDHLSTIEICFANEINSVNYMESFYKLLDLCKSNYIDFHKKINEKYYEVLLYKDEDIDPDNIFQCIVCNNYTQVFKFKEGDYEHRKTLANFKNPGKIYSFYDGYVIVIENDNKMDFNYEELDINIRVES